MATGSSTLVSVDSDGGLVLRALAGERAGFAMLYDRFAARIYDLHLTLLRDQRLAAEATYRTFQRAIADLNRLGNPAELRRWIYRRAYRQSGGRTRRSGIPPAPVPTLGERDRALLVLRFRHRLEPSEIGFILGVSARRVRRREKRLPARLGHALHEVLAAPSEPVTTEDGWPDEDEPVGATEPAPVAFPPPELRLRVLTETALFTAHQGVPRPRTPAAWTATALAVMLVVTGTALFVQRDLERKPIVAATFGPSSELALSTTVLDLGATGSTATVTLSNNGPEQLAWRSTSADPWLTAAPKAGTLGGGQQQQVTVTINRAALRVGDARSQLTVSSADGQGQGVVSVAAREQRPPAITNARASSNRIGGFGCPTVAQISATVRDESPPLRVLLVGPGQQSQVMQVNGDTYTGRLGSGTGANISWRIVATNSRGETATTPARVISRADCAARPTPVRPPPSAAATPAPTPSQEPSTEPTPGQASDRAPEPAPDPTDNAEPEPNGATVPPGEG
ncbi:BACON domain-containing protein [Pseudonocardia acaciae]|uniref:BACON domain-containing protein n=1 Tax=Pseudonocardia acaciae TaxID=551276 RepID=UPI00048ED428|nr:sigma factor-like helix-turn-helix DNA-binding protein [Pseudonocardia acaciae]